MSASTDRWYRTSHRSANVAPSPFSSTPDPRLSVRWLPQPTRSNVAPTGSTSQREARRLAVIHGQTLDIHRVWKFGAVAAAVVGLAGCGGLGSLFSRGTLLRRR